MGKHKRDITRPFHAAVARLERQLIVAAYEKTGNASRAAQRLGLTRPTFYARCDAFGLQFRRGKIWQGECDVELSGETSPATSGLRPILFAVRVARDHAWAEGVWTSQDAVRLVKGASTIALCSDEGRARGMVVLVQSKLALRASASVVRDSARRLSVGQMEGTDATRQATTC